ncbi:MAG: ferredoxin--NADP+ reductase Fpr [Idiomarinaceae bacterium HL-53]|nr:MAG: ferredoxin--NADP+ reductase Fpr [Idiomarinaceae bacterium HL-53]CUS48112.1 ferredoxin--NADP+ reductase [Idiomarinaceae bacterium HL-53]
MSGWVEGRIVEKKYWNPTLLSLRIEVPPFDFIPGQFVRIGVPTHDKPIFRAYSLVSQPTESQIEFIITIVPDGLFTPTLNAMREGDTLLVTQPPSGFFTLKDVPPAHSMWMMSTGTGIGPFLSMLKSGQPWSTFERVVLVHAVRTAEDLCYQELIAEWQETHPQQFRYIPILSRDHQANTLKGRIPHLIENEQLEKAAGCKLDLSAQVMLCGNPGMIQDTRQLLEARGMNLNLRRKPGHVTVEQYWKA